MEDFSTLRVIDLRSRAKEMGLSGYSKFNKEKLVEFVKQATLSRMSIARNPDTSLVLPQASRTTTPVKEGKREISPEKSPPKHKPARPKKRLSKEVISIKSSPERSSVKKSIPRLEKVPKATKQYKRISRKVGPKTDPEKYGLVKLLGKGRYGATYKAVNLNRKDGEDEYYAVKVLLNNKEEERVKRSWTTEVKCLQEVYVICHTVGILCYKESFIREDQQILGNILLLLPY